MRQYYIQNKTRNSIPIGMAFFSHQTVSFWYYCIIPISIYTLPSLSVQLLHVDVSLSEHSDQKVRLHALGQTVCQLSASVNPFDLISCWVILLTCFRTIDPQSLSQRGEFKSQALVLHLARNLARQVVTQGAAICEVPSRVGSVHTIFGLISNGQSTHKAKHVACLQTQLTPAECKPQPAV